MRKNFYYALAILIGTTVGGGIFGLPYVIAKAGLITSFFYFLVLGTAVLLVTLFFGEIILSTEEDHRLVGYAKKYLGKKGEIIITLSTVLGMVGALLAYVIIGGNFLKIVLPSIGLSATHFSFLFWLALSFFVYKGIKLVAPAELVMNICLGIILVLVFGFAMPHIDPQNFEVINWSNVFLPFGVILFALVGWTALPEISELFQSKKDHDNYKRVIILGMGIVILIYFLFSAAVVGVSGSETTQEAFQGLMPFLGSNIVRLGALLGVLAVAASFLVLSLYLKDTFKYDFNIAPWKAFLITSVPPIILFALGMRSFIEVLGITGTVIGALEGSAIVLIFKEIKKKRDQKPEYSLSVPNLLLYLLITVFLIGAIVQFI
ncbi:MAG: aromatic amino acid transport family protein [Candidatus Paceibacterota bacterium]